MVASTEAAETLWDSETDSYSSAYSNAQRETVLTVLKAALPEEDYFVIGTEFYKTSCNLPNTLSGERKNHTFYSHDQLAKASYKCGFSESYLDFSCIPPDSSLRAQVDDYTWMGSLGEGYTPIIMSLLPRSYRVWRSPATLYDAMIFVTYAHPTEIRSSDP